jgi:hypothetical protein
VAAKRRYVCVSVVAVAVVVGVVAVVVGAGPFSRLDPGY